MQTVSDIMTTDVVTLAPEATIREAMEALSINHLSGVPVVRGGRVIGVMSMTDIVSFMVESGGLDEANVFDEHTVSELMTYEVFSVPPETPIKTAASLMKQHAIHRVLVMSDRKLEGIVSALDIAQLVSRTGIAGKSGVKPDPCKDRSAWITV